MALPVTISGISTDLAVVGPFTSSTGNLYLFGKDDTVDTTLRCCKATDPTSWSSVATNTGFTDDIADVIGVQDGDVIHFAIVDGLSVGPNSVKYCTFNMATDAFVISETVIAEFYASTTAGVPKCALAVRSGSAPVIAYCIKTPSALINYSRRTGTNTWSDPVEVASNYISPVAILGDSDEIQFLYSDLNYTYQRALDSSNVLKTPTSIATVSRDPTGGISFDLGGTTKCIAVTKTTNAIYFDAGDTPTLNAVSLGSASMNVQSLRLFARNAVAYVLYSKDSGSNRDYYFRSSTDGGATWAAEIFICHSVNDAAFQNTSRFAKLYPDIDDIILPFVYTDSGAVKHNHKVVATTAVNVSIAAATSSAAYTAVAKKINKSSDSASSSAAASVPIKQAAISINAVSGATAHESFIAEGADVRVNLASAVFSFGAGGFGIGRETAGTATRVSLTRLGPGGYPIATLPGTAAGPETDVSLFSVASGAAVGSLVECRFLFGLPVAVSPAAAGLSTWTNGTALSIISAAARAATASPGIQTGALSSSISSATSGQFNPTNFIWLVDLDISASGLVGASVPENSRILPDVYSTGVVGDFAPYAFTGTSVALNSAATQAVADQPVALNESLLQAVSAYAAQNIIHLEGDEAFNLAAAAAAGTVGDLLVAIVIPPAIQWLVCASIDIVPEVAGDFAMNAELQATVIAAAALQGSPQIGAEVEGVLEIAPLVGGSPSMKEC